MNPHHLELFYHVAKSKGVSRAVRQMPYGIQQPSVSAQVNALERDLGVTLYERRPFKLTPAGEELFRFVEPFFGSINEVRAKLQGAAQFRIGASPIVFRDYLPPVLEAIQRQFPRLNMILRALNQPELIDAIEHDELDAVISLIPDKLGPGFHAVDIMELPIILLVAKRSKIKSANDLWSNKKITEPLISLKPNELICQLFQETLTNRGLSIRAPGRTCPSTIRALKLADFPTVRLGVISRSESKHEPEACHAFLEEVRRQAARFPQRK